MWIQLPSPCRFGASRLPPNTGASLPLRSGPILAQVVAVRRSLGRYRLSLATEESVVASPPVRSGTWRRTRRTAALAARLGPVPPILAAVLALLEPWARARVIGVFGVTRSPEAVVMLLGVLALALVGAQIAARRGPHRAGMVHVGIGIAMGCVSVMAYRMVRDAGVKALWVIPVASVRPGRGLVLYAAAAFGFILLGIGEILLSRRAARRYARVEPA